MFDTVKEETEMLERASGCSLMMGFSEEQNKIREEQNCEYERRVQDARMSKHRSIQSD